MSLMSGSTGSSRSLPRDIAELRALAERQPELAPAARLQIELVESQRRVQGRLTTPWVEAEPADLAARLTAGRPLLEFSEIAFEWSDVRLLIRQTTDVLRRFDAIDADAADALQAMGRDPKLPDVMRDWFAGHQPAQAIEMRDEVLTWAARPYLQRMAEVLQQRVSFDGWRRPTCPVCSAQPDFSVITTSGDRQLVCGRCHARWTFDPIACPFCGNDDRARITSLATPDGMYRVMACLACGGYLKALDARHANRPLLPYADPILTLPLDAVVMQKYGMA